MPIPKPKKGEKQADFIARCMADDAMKEYPTDDGGKNQRLAVCETAWREAHGGEKPKEKSAPLALVVGGRAGRGLDTVVRVANLQIRSKGVAPEKRANETDAEFTKRAAESDLPDGVCGRLTGVMLVYNVVDDWGTAFAPGCLAKTNVGAVQQRKVKLYADHKPFIHSHVGTVTRVEDVGGTAVMTADIFDTADGRSAKEYLEAVIASDSTTGLSVGFVPRDDEWVKPEEVGIKGDPEDASAGGLIFGRIQYFREIELRHVGLTPENAVPGADVLAVRNAPDDEGEPGQDLLARTLRAILHSVPEPMARSILEEVYAPVPASTTDAPAPSSTAPPASAEHAGGSAGTVSDERLMATRRAIAAGFAPRD